MARLPYVDPSTADEKLREVFASLPAPLNVFKMLANAPTHFGPMVRLGTAILGRSAISPVLRELAILRVARSSGCTYEWGQHVVIGRAVGVSDEQIAALERDDLAAACFDDAQRAGLRLVTEVARDVRASDATFAAAAAHFDGRQLVELIITTGYYRMLAGMLESCAVDWDEAIGQQLLQRLR